MGQFGTEGLDSDCTSRRRDRREDPRCQCPDFRRLCCLRAAFQARVLRSQCHLQALTSPHHCYDDRYSGAATGILNEIEIRRHIK